MHVKRVFSVTKSVLNTFVRAKSVCRRRGLLTLFLFRLLSPPRFSPRLSLVFLTSLLSLHTLSKPVAGVRRLSYRGTVDRKERPLCIWFFQVIVKQN